MDAVTLQGSNFSGMDQYANVDVEVLFRRVGLYVGGTRRREVEVVDRFMESIEMSMCDWHFKEFAAENADKIERFRLYLGFIEATSARNHIFEHFVCGAMERMRPEAWAAFREFMDGEERLREHCGGRSRIIPMYQGICDDCLHHSDVPCCQG